MAKGGKKSADSQQVIHYQHADDKRTNIPTAVTAGQGSVPKAEKKRYYYNPHLAPVLRFDPSGKADKITALLEKARREPITAEEHQLLAEALRNHQPWLEWTGKREAEEKGWFDVDPVALNIHERISTQAILRSARREDVQRDLFADPHEPWQEAVKFYQHDIDWTNRLILGDSLQVMSSLAHRENLADKVQMIYIDPPYGIRYASNFQAEVRKRDVKEKDQDLTREAEMVKAYRDTWNLGVHSYLAYLKDRLQLSRQLLSDYGSIFVQIGDENLHHVREILENTFGAHNLCSIITVVKTAGQASELVANVCDYILWYAKDRSQVRFRQCFRAKADSVGESAHYAWAYLPWGERRGLRSDELSGQSKIPPGTRLYAPTSLTSQGGSASGPFAFRHNAKAYTIAAKDHWKTTESGMSRLALESPTGSNPLVFRRRLQ